VFGLFRRLEGDDLQRFSDARRARHYRRGHNLYYDGDPARCLFCIQTGRVKLHKIDSTGKEYVLRLAGPSDLLGLEAMFSTGGQYVSDAVMLEDGAVCTIDREVVLDLVRSDPSVAEDVMRALADRLREADEERLGLAYHTARERLARLLAILGTSYGKRSGSSIVLDLPISREELAGMVGTATESAIRILGDFAKKGLLDVEGRHVTLRDPIRLSDIGKGH
jgi:CRP/FNR family transcriptional regulator